MKKNLFLFQNCMTVDQKMNMILLDYICGLCSDICPMYLNCCTGVNKMCDYFLVNSQQVNVVVVLIGYGPRPPLTSNSRVCCVFLNMSSFSILSTVPKLKGRENYSDWTFAVGK
ncbi:hypothetical protein PPYR_15266 [Photinus pyralis]|uniref:Uncharacterized protein n=1 Tax=Photinus pyralis TaxID=7054 RepID=A0A5N3ZZB6_PHOPY|nr:hypothetical protein PPYR_15266 [Photinus pyralis]